jgi:hypothetical protein
VISRVKREENQQEIQLAVLGTARTSTYTTSSKAVLLEMTHRYPHLRIAETEKHKTRIDETPGPIPIGLLRIAISG